MSHSDFISLVYIKRIEKSDYYYIIHTLTKIWNICLWINSDKKCIIKSFDDVFVSNFSKQKTKKIR